VAASISVVQSARAARSPDEIPSPSSPTVQTQSPRIVVERLAAQRCTISPRSTKLCRYRRNESLAVTWALDQCPPDYRSRNPLPGRLQVEVGRSPEKCVIRSRTVISLWPPGIPASKPSRDRRCAICPVRTASSAPSCGHTFVSDEMSKMVSAAHRLARRNQGAAPYALRCTILPSVPTTRTAPGINPYRIAASTTASRVGMQRTSPAPVRLV